MTRTPLRPLARVLEARQLGENPDKIERENIRLRHEEMRDRARMRAEGRLFMLALFFVCAFGMIGVRMGVLASTIPEEPVAVASGVPIVASRADITDRNGRILATNLTTYSLYAQPKDMVDPVRAAQALAMIFPDLDVERLVRDFTGSRTFVWIKRRISPEQLQLVHDIGDPGLLFGPREMRLYPNGAIASHILGGAAFGREGVRSAEVIGTAGVEKTYDGWLRDPANEGQPLRLSIDLTLQAAVEDVLAGGMQFMNAKGAAAILMDVHTGEVLAMASLPDFDPNERPAPPVSGDPSDSPIFNRAVQGVYELGSTFKIFTSAQAMELGLMTPETMVDTRSPMRWGRFSISDFHNYGAQNTLMDVIVKSSNVGSARIAQIIGAERQRTFLASLGLMEPLSTFELAEAPGIRPLFPDKNWSELSAMTISYGHGLSTSPLHLAAAYASLLNGGLKVTPTLLAGRDVAPGPRVVSAEVSAISRQMLRGVVDHGTATLADVPGYSVGGKTGTAEKPLRTGRGYDEDKVVATFAGVFPTNDPKYVIIVSLDEPTETSGVEDRRTAGWTAAPVAAEIIRRAGPILGLRPEIALSQPVNVSLARN